MQEFNSQQIILPDLTSYVEFIVKSTEYYIIMCKLYIYPSYG